MTTTTEQPDDDLPGEHAAPADYTLKYGGVDMDEADLIHVCQELVNGVDDEYLRAAYRGITTEQEFVDMLNGALGYHTNAIITGMRHLAATRDRGEQTVQ